MKERAKALFKEAIKNVSEANEELCRPQEDVVSIMVCKKSQLAVNDFLRGFLLQQGVEPKIDMTLEELYKGCLTINPNFKKVDLTNFDCRSVNMNSKDCNDVSKVSECFITASNLDTFLREEKVI
tara:strand:+ start:13472 stop:13846 length:375 start_codon:yes stop_codon:yes gene_type:complete